MIFIYILFVLTILINPSQPHNLETLRTDYYESLSLERHCLVVSHYHKTGPLFLFGHFNYKLSSFIFGFMSKNMNFNIGFKKIDKPCNSFIIFSTIVNDFRKLRVEIFIYFFYFRYIATYINCTIYPGIFTGFYEFWDWHKHFSLRFKIINDMKKNLIISNSSLKDIKSYLNSILITNGEICLVTNNNKEVSLNQDYGSVKPDGLLTGFEVKFFQGEDYFDSLLYAAFECNKNQVYPDETILLIIDRTEFDIHFYAIYSKLSGEDVVKTEFELQIKNGTFVYVNDLEYIKKQTKNVFVMIDDRESIFCPDNTWRIKYLSFERIVYYVTKRVYINVTSSLEQTRDISYPPTRPC